MQRLRIRLWPATVIAFLVLSGIAQTQQSVFFQLVEVKPTTPCSAWGDITFCDPNVAKIHWAGAYNTDYEWTPPPQQFGPEGFTVTMNVVENNPRERASATGLKLNGGGLDVSPSNSEVAVGGGNQPMSGSLTVMVKPPANAGKDYYMSIGVFWGPGFTYHYRATTQPITPPTPPPSTCSWTGTWKVNDETFAFVQSGMQVTGTGVTDPSWRLSGTVSGNVLTGKWSNSKDSGSIRITMNADCNSFSTSWGQGDDATTFKGNGTRTSNKPTTPTTPKQPNTDVPNMTIQAAERQVIAGDIVLVPVWLIKAKNVANINFQISYDANVVRPEGTLTKGNLLDNAIFSVNANQSGNILCGFAQTSGLSGTGTVLNIPFRAIGKPGDQTPLNITVTAINDPAGTTLPIDRIHGHIWIFDKSGKFPKPPIITGGGGDKPLPPPNILQGDCDGDSAVTELDAVCALEMSVQLRPSNSVMDVDGNGVVDSRDAVIILQRALKK